MGGGVAMHALRSAVLLLLAALAAVLPPANAQEPARSRLEGHLVPGIANARRVDPPWAAGTPQAAARAAEPVALTLVLRRTDAEGFRRHLADLYDPRSPGFRRFAPPLALSDRFGPGVDDYALVRDYFTGHGFVVLEESGNRLTLRVIGTRAQVEAALAVELHDYELQGRRFRANDREPVLPREVAARIEAVVGLSDLARPSHLNATFQSLDRCMKNAAGVYTPDLQLACTLIYGVDAALYDIACAFIVVVITLDLGLTGLGAAAAGGVVNRITGCHFVYPGGPTPNVASRTGANPPTGPPALPGSGQKVGIVAFDTFEATDVANFIRLVGSPPGQLARISEVKLSGGATPGADQDEVLLDIAQVITLSPGAEVVVYDIPFALGSFQAMFNRMLTDGMTVVSNSWSYCEDQTAAADLNSMDSVLASLAASGITVLNASGDTGSTCLDGAPNTIGVPAGSPHATAVGGSSYTWGPAPLYTGTERWWNGANSNPPTGQGGFGVSRHYARPAFQNGFTGSAFRSIPDVVAAADPVTNGKPICQAAKGGCPSGLFYGGTSVAAPLWAAIVANLNAGLGSELGWLNPQIYPLAGTPALHGPGELASDFAHVGLGSPNMVQLYLRLAGESLGAVSASLSDVVATPAEVAADGVSAGTVVVQLRDVRGLPVPGKTVSLVAAPGTQAQVTPATAVTSNANGAVQFQVRDATIETVAFTATDVSDNLPIAAASIKFVPPPATAGSINAFPSPVPANGTSTATIVVALQDARGLPATGKRITLQQGGGHAVVTGPSPPVTDAFGQVQFQASNRVAESVTFTAVDVTDGDLPIPGSATVVYDNSTNTSCAVAPIAAAGYTIAAFATGFVAENFFFGNVNWGGCPGASNPTFDTQGNVLVTDFRTGDLFRFGLDGGAATSPLANAGITVGQPTFGLDGRLYATHGATTGNFTTGNIVELDPVTGATLRVVAANLTCPNGLAVDPLSGDLFFDGSCFGAGSDRPQLFRITDPAGTDPGRPTEVVTYATLPTTPNGAIAFSPDGTIYVAVGYNTVRQVYRVAGTDQPQPAALAQVPNLNALFWVNVGEVNPDGSAKSLIVLGTTDPFPLQLADLGTDPPTLTPLTTNGASSGTIGPDGCLYAQASDRVFKLAPASGACRFSATNPTPALALSPPSVQPAPLQGTTLQFVAQLHNADPEPGQGVSIQVTGANTALQVVPFDANGRAEFSYTGLSVGTDSVRARTVRNGVEMLSNPARITWVAGERTTALDLSLSPGAGIAGRFVPLSARLVDRSTEPATPVAGATVQFSIAGPACAASTNANGIASCTATAPAAGVYTLLAQYAGAGALKPSSAGRSFLVTADSAADGMFANGFE